MSGLPLEALRYRNFRLLWLGQLVSVTGSAMQTAAILWHVSLLVSPEKKGLALGLVGLVRIAPIIVFSLISGVVADAFDRRKLMLVSQVGMGLAAAGLSLASYTGQDSVYVVYALAAITGALVAFDAPARQALVPSLVPPEVLPNAISLNTIMFQTASTLGPTLSGFVIARAGVPWTYAANAGSFAAVLGALLLMRDLPAPKLGEAPKVTLGAALEGLRFVWSAPLIRSTMLLDFFATFFSSAMALLPIFAQDILAVGPEGYGWLSAAPSAGALVASLLMVRFSDRIERRGKVLIGAVMIYGLTTVIFGVSHSFTLCLIALAASGAADTVSMVLRGVIRQLATPDRLRGRMTSVNMIFFMGGPQLGELEAGLVATAFGAPISVISGGVATLICTWLIAARTPELVEYRRP